MVPSCSEAAAASGGARGEGLTRSGWLRLGQQGKQSWVEEMPSSLSKSRSLSLSAAVICKTTFLQTQKRDGAGVGQQGAGRRRQGGNMALWRQGTSSQAHAFSSPKTVHERGTTAPFTPSDLWSWAGGGKSWIML